VRHTPRDRLYARALRGCWDRFPGSPEPFYERLVNGLGDGYRPKSATFRLERRIQAARERLDRTTANDPAARLAARRALVAWCYRAMQRCDDSYGVIGELAREALLTYATLPFEPAGITDEDWCEDLCELLAWEDWGLLHRHETKPYPEQPIAASFGAGFLYRGFDHWYRFPYAFLPCYRTRPAGGGP